MVRVVSVFNLQTFRDRNFWSYSQFHLRFLGTSAERRDLVRNQDEAMARSLMIDEERERERERERKEQVRLEGVRVERLSRVVREAELHEDHVTVQSQSSNPATKCNSPDEPSPHLSSCVGWKPVYSP